MPIPPPTDPTFEQRVALWRQAALAKWGMSRVLGEGDADMPQINDGEFPEIEYGPLGNDGEWVYRIKQQGAGNAA